MRALGSAVGALAGAIIITNAVTGFDAETFVATLVGLLAGLSAVFARITITLTGGTIRFSFFPFLRVAYDLAQVRRATVVRIDPVRLGGVGIRRSRGARVLAMSAGRGVRVETTRGTIIVQSTMAERIAAALTSAV
ncbi:MULTISPECIES: hypothetical protein [unclassified Curtobacterium]|uniref:hypothetical protein n=1 Tax=unclassified Curtobacterium TaxID=257496 RepID=UPI000D815CE9|nr:MULTISPECIES: hypothetical protein [unclassified Curtobacterium]PYY36641.1 hypothetical protein DEJ32_12800 [Curtobacterium sp. MCPF17_046]WIB15049.1 hypothetical protein DEJ34_13005 [Curtobacterium sp. MCPF17_050]